MWYPILWIPIALIAGVGLTLLVNWVRNRGITVKWWEWLIGAIGLALFFFTLQNFVTAFDELETQAAWVVLLMLGLPSFILMGLAVRFVWSRNRASAQ